MAEIVLDHVTKRFPDGALAVDDVNMTIADGEFVILVGPSGCGKSTTLNMIAGLEDISDGELRIGGEGGNQKSPRDRDIGMVFQSYALYPHMTVRENMAFSLRLRRADQALTDQRVADAARILNLDAPLENLDAKLRVAMRAEIKALHQRLKTTTVYVTHDQIEAMTMADRIVVMHDGRIEQIGEPLHLYDHPDNLFV